jgi:hypothetical protein
MAHRGKGEGVASLYSCVHVHNFIVDASYSYYTLDYYEGCVPVRRETDIDFSRHSAILDPGHIVWLTLSHVPMISSRFHHHVQQTPRNHSRMAGLPTAQSSTL